MATQQQLRAEVTALADRGVADLDKVLDATGSRAETREVLREVLPALTGLYYEAASAVAMDWYDEYRDDVAPGGRFRAVPAPVRDLGGLQLADWATGYGNDAASVRGLLIGGFTKRVMFGARDTITGSAISDRAADGWMRVGYGACKFCQMLIGRGAVYSKATVSFAAHDNCKCQAVPKFPGATPFDVDDYRTSLRRRTAETKAKDAARAREWIADNL